MKARDYALERLAEMEQKSRERDAVWNADIKTMESAFGVESQTAARYRDAHQMWQDADEKLIAWARNYAETCGDLEM